MRLIGFLSILLLIFPVLAYSYVSVSGARQMAERGEALVIDVRHAEYYEEEHVAGAILFPLDGMELQIRSGKQPFSQEDALILYCDCPAEESSLIAASILEHYGFAKIYVMKGGWQAWKDAGFPTVVGKESGSLRKMIVLPSTTPSAVSPHPVQNLLPQSGKKDYTPYLFSGFLLVGICAVLLILIHFFLKNKS